MTESQPLPSAPRVLLFDWHGTLVDTLAAMFAATEDLLPQLDELGLVERLLPEAQCKSADDAKLVRYIRIFRHLHPRILAERRVSRTDIFNAIFGDDRDAKRIAHAAYNRCYRDHVGDVTPFQDGVYAYLRLFARLGIRLGIATNRSREFLDRELAAVDGGRWQGVFETSICADDVAEYKPAPDVILAALAALEEAPGDQVWYVGDSYSDVVAARAAGVTPVFYNGLHWERDWFVERFADDDPGAGPAAVIESFDELVDLLERVQAAEPSAYPLRVAEERPPAYPPPPPQPPPPRVVPDWHPAVARLAPPQAILFDWHATLVDTMDAMYHAVDDMLPEFAGLGLMQRLADPSTARSPQDARLIEYVRAHAALHPKIKADRKISRTDIFEVLFADDQEAKQAAHARFNEHYRRHYGSVRPFEPDVRAVLQALRELPVRLGVITNRDREFFERELALVEGGAWQGLFDADVCGDDTPLRKPHPDPLQLAARRLGCPPGAAVWYVGDSTTDTISAKRAGITSVFFNGAQWDLLWLRKIFPGSARYPYKPDVVVNDFAELWSLVLACWKRSARELPLLERS